MSLPTQYKARWVIPVDRPPIENGVIEVRDGRITEVRPARPNESHMDWFDCGDTAILPGLVNAHTHLEFSLLQQPIEPALPFVDWIRSLVAYRRSELTEAMDRHWGAVSVGASEAVSTGTTLIGEIATRGWIEPTMPQNSPHLVVFRELIGLSQKAGADQLEQASAWFAREASENVTCGLSPHAPYSVGPDLLARLIVLAKRFNAPVAMHVAETREELQLLADGTGPFVELLKSFGAWPEEGLPTGRRPIDILQVLADAPYALVVHGNYLAEDELQFIAARRNMSVVYCPRTHEYFGHEPHPWRRLLELGANVAIGTDGRGSNPDLSLWNELLYLRAKFPDVAPSRLLELGTLAGARALGRERDSGSITIGKRADLLVVSLAGAAASVDPLETIFEAGRDLKGVMLAGELE